ncbi:MAG: class I SAM-dependent DNA methyltransferase [Thermomicrobiales bacterium]
MTDLVDDCQKRRFWQQVNESVERLRANPAAWKSYQHEIDELEGGSFDELEGEEPHYSPGDLEERAVYTDSASIYDAIYGSRFDAAASARKVCELIGKQKQSAGASLLDVACGTGRHLVHLRDHYAVEGLDVSPEMVEIARAKLPGISIHVADMVEFDLGRRFDVILCLGSSIGYVKTMSRLRRTLKNFARHLHPGGLLLVEPWIAPDAWENGRVAVDASDEPNLKIARVLVSGLSGRVSTLDIHHLVARGTTVDTFVEHHEFGLFTREDTMAAFRNAGFTVEHDPVGLSGRGLYIGIAPM